MYSTFINLKVKEVLLHKAASGLAGCVVVDQGSILLCLRGELVSALSGLVHKEVSHVLGSHDSVA